MEQYHYEVGETALADYVLMRMNDNDSATMNWGFHLNKPYGHITDFELQAFDAERRHTTKWTMGFKPGPAIVLPSDLALYDYDGTVKTEEVVKESPPINFTLTDDELVVILEDPNKGYVALYTTTGQLVNMQQIEDTQVKIDTRNLLTGIYYLNVVEGKRSRSAAIFIKGQTR